ncbi:MAG: hypothetical protein ABFC94_00445 [Syntrophomonas sp.]
MNLKYLREFNGPFSQPWIGEEEAWSIATDGDRYAFIWNLDPEQVPSYDWQKGIAGVRWFKTRNEAESALLDLLEYREYYVPLEDIV